MYQRPPSSPRPYTLFPYTTLVRSYLFETVVRDHSRKPEIDCPLARPKTDLGGALDGVIIVLREIVRSACSRAYGCDRQHGSDADIEAVILSPAYERLAPFEDRKSVG